MIHLIPPVVAGVTSLGISLLLNRSIPPWMAFFAGVSCGVIAAAGVAAALHI